MRTVDVVVVGGGPAGSAAATVLARADREVLLVDKATFPRDKFCGDGITTGALRQLDKLGFDPMLVKSWQPVDDIIVVAPSGREVRFPLPTGQGTFAAVSRRIDFDDALLNLARAAGAEVRDGHACTAARHEPGGVVLDVDGLGSVHAPHVVAADGMWSPLRKMLGGAIPGYLGESHAFRQYFINVGPKASRDLYVWFEPDLLPGYAWSFPLPNGGANVGLGIHRGSGYTTRQMKTLWPELLQRPHIAEVLGPAAEPESAHRAWPVPARVTDIRLTSGRALFVGDAAATTDPMTGEGIGQALRTGMRAAEAILHGPPATAAKRYEEFVHHDLFADHRMSMFLLRGLKYRRGAEAAVATAGATAWTRRNFARWLFEDYPRALVVTPKRWHRQMFTAPGPY